MQEETFSNQIALFYRNYNLSDKDTSLITTFLSQLCKDRTTFKNFLRALNDEPIAAINFNSWKKILRMIKKSSKIIVDDQVQELITSYIVKSAHQYFPYEIRTQGNKRFSQLLQIARGLKMASPKNLKDQRQVILYLNTKWDLNFETALVEIINNEVLVDKKSRNPNGIKINKFFGPFISANFPKILPQLQRLLVRSTSNIQVWQQFFDSCSPIQNFHPHILQLLHTLKMHLLAFPQYTISMINSLTSCIADSNIGKQVIEFFSSLINNEHQAKKKLMLIQMLQGIINSLKRYPNVQLTNQLFLVFMNTWSKFSQEQDFKIIANILDMLLPLINDPSQDIAQVCKTNMKSNNKYLLICLGITLTTFTSAHIGHYQSLIIIENHFKNQILKLVNKIQNCWQWVPYIISFISKVDPTNLDYFNEDFPIFKKASLPLQKVQRKAIIKLILEIIIRSSQNQQQIPKYLLLSLCLLLQNTRDQQIWKQINKLSVNIRFKIISAVIYPCLWFNCPPSKSKNISSFVSLTQFILKGTKQQLDLAQSQAYRVLIVAQFLNIKIKTKGQPNENTIQHYLKVGLFNYETDETTFPIERRVQMCHKGGCIGLELRAPNFLYKSLQILSRKKNYESNLGILEQFKEQLNIQVKIHQEQLEKDKQMLQQGDFFVEQKKVTRKAYGHDINIKMMSQAQVKQEKYRKHFLGMHYYFQKLMRMILQKGTAERILPEIWQRYLNELIHIAIYPQHRFLLYSLTNKSCEEFYKSCLKQNHFADGIVFYSFSSFLGDLFVNKGAQMTPTVKLMENCDKFLRKVMAIQFQKLSDNYIIKFINIIGENILENMQFDVSLKKLTVQLYARCAQKKLKCWNPSYVFSNLVKNINILSSSSHILELLEYCISQISPERCSELFDEILNFIPSTKKLILQVVSRYAPYKPLFEDYIKLRILSLEGSVEIQDLAKNILQRDQSHLNSITDFNMKRFIEKNSKETIEKLCQFMRQCMNEELATPIFQMAIKTALQLYIQNFDEQGLQFFPYFVSLNIDFIKEEFFQPIFDLLIMHYTTNPEHANLSRLSLEIGVDIIKKYAQKSSAKLLQVLESYINKGKGISNIILLGVLAPFLSNKNSANFLIVQKRLMGLFEGDHQSEQKSIAKCMPDLMSFFKEPLKKVQAISSTIQNLNQKSQIAQSYLLVGLLKGIGPAQALKRLDVLLSEDYPFKTKSDKSARLWQLNVFAQILGRVVETRALRFTQLVISSTADANEDIRDLARKVGQVLIMKMSSYSVKELLPNLLKGLQSEQNWRIKISYIWILGIMAHSSARQLQTSLPIIVPTLSSCLSNAHPNIRDKAAEALSLIGQTIKNPEISQSVEILIEALQNPFEKSHRALDVLLKTRFSHFIDPPSLSIIIPIVDYCLRGRSSDLKAGACQIMGSVCQLIQDPYTLLPYIKLIIGGLKVALCDPLSQIRAISSKCIGMISNKIGAVQAQQNFKFVIEIIESSQSNTTQKQGAAQAYSQMICSQDYDYFQESLNRLFDKLNVGNSSAKQGYILVFLYVPGIRTQEFEGFIKQVNENMYCFVSDQDQNIRNSALQVEKVLINNYCISHTDLLLEPLCQGVFESNWRRRNAALILIGEMLNIIKSYLYNNRTTQKSYAYYQGLMAVYILKDDELQMPRMTANQVWNAYIENTPKTIKTGLKELVKMWTRFTHAANGVVFTNIIAFSGKYGQNYFYEILQHLDELIEDKVYRKGVFEVLSEFIKRLTQQFLSKETYKQHIRDFFTKYILVIESDVRESLAKSMALYVQKMHEQAYFQQLLYPQINKMQTLSEEDPAYTNILHLIRDFLHTSSRIVVDRLVRKVFQRPLFNFKIQVITNNANRISNHLYTLFSKPATNILLEEIYSIVNDPSQQSRLKLIVYCLNQVSSNLNVTYRTKYIDLITGKIRQLTDSLDSKDSQKLKILEVLLEMVLYFLGAIPIEQIENLQTLISDISVLIKFQGQVVLLTHKIFLLLLSNPKSVKTPLYFRQLLVSLQNNLQGNSIWNNPEIVQEYVTVMVQSLAYGSTAVIEEVIRMIGFMLTSSPKDIIDKQIIRIMGPVIRVTNYPLLANQKLSLLDFIHRIFDLGFTIDVYHNQILSVCYRGLYELRTNLQVCQIVAIIFEDLLQHSPRKTDLILAILTKSKGFNENLVRSIYILIKSLIGKPQAFNKNTYQLIHKQLMNSLNQTEAKPSVKVTYYISKTAARIGVFLGQNVKTYEGSLESITCSYESLLHFLHFCYYSKLDVPKLNRVGLFLSESSREKVYYLLKSIKLCTKYSELTKTIHSVAYLTSLIPQNLRGFDDISDILERFQ